RPQVRGQLLCLHPAAKGAVGGTAASGRHHEATVDLAVVLAVDQTLEVWFVQREGDVWWSHGGEHDADLNSVDRALKALSATLGDALVLEDVGGDVARVWGRCFQHVWSLWILPSPSRLGRVGLRF